MKDILRDEDGFGIQTALTGLLVIVFLAAIMPTILSANGDLMTALAGHTVEIVLVGLIPVALIIAAIVGIFKSDDTPVYQETGY